MDTKVLARVLRPGSRCPGVPGTGESLYARDRLGAGDDRAAWLLGPGEHLELDTWAAGLPAAWWREMTSVRQVTLRVDVVAGHGELRLLRTSQDSRPGEIGRVTVGAGESGELTADLDPGIGWLVCQLQAGPRGMKVANIRWMVARAVEVPPVTVAVTTFNRVHELLALVDDLDDEDLVEMIHEVVVIDQGTDAVRQRLQTRRRRSSLTVRVVEQPNQGGSGGFARGMLEALRADTEGVLLLDDDIRVDPESVRRLIVAAAACTSPTILGGAMLSLHEPSRLHALGETVQRARFWWGPSPGTSEGLDLEPGLTAAPWLHSPPRCDYAGWWMCLVPTSAIAQCGLPAPFFIKWDDVEFGLRAAARGTRTITWPGAWAWHVAWTRKSAETDWTAYFLMRNRLVTALIHSDRQGLLALECLALTARQVLRSGPAPAGLRLLAMSDVLAGPEWLHDAQIDARSSVLARTPGAARWWWRVRTCARAAGLAARLAARWSALALRYRAALERSTGAAVWKERLRGAGAPDADAPGGGYPRPNR